MSGFRKLDEKILYEGFVVTVANGRFEAPDGSIIHRDVIHHPGAVSVVPLDGDDHIIMVRQYRAAIEGYLLEIPAGKRDVADEPPIETARRELIEEIGKIPGNLHQLAEFYNTAGFCDEYSYVYLGTDLTDTDLQAQGVEEEHMTIERIALDDIDSMIASGELCDAKSLIGISLALRHLGR